MDNENKKNILKKVYEKYSKIYQKKEVRGILSGFVSKLSQEGNTTKISRFNRKFGEKYKQLGLNFADTSTIDLQTIPAEVKDRFVSKDDNSFLITVYPKSEVWHLDYLKRFYNQMKEVTPGLAGTPPMFYNMINILSKDGRTAAILTVIIVFIFLLIDFRSFSKSILAMIPLLTGFIWMLGLMVILGLKLTLVNVMGLPLILGIGIDDGVHILHRYEMEGSNSVKEVYSSTGKAIIMTSLTTMISFGSLVFATYRGYGSLGRALFIGVGACLMTTIFYIPTLLGMKQGE